MNEIVFVLVRPYFLGNIGSVCRVLKNFGYRHLRLVNPPRNYKDAEARKMSVGAFDILKSSQVFESLAEALQDVHTAVGTTSGQQRDRETISLDALGRRLSSSPGASDEVRRIAIVFGDERDGLLSQELDRCHLNVRISTADDFPSLNLAQAAGIIAYELSRSGTLGTSVGVSAAVDSPSWTTGAQDDEFFRHVQELLTRVQFLRSYNTNVVMTELRCLYQRAQPTARELDLLKGALRRLTQHCGSTQ